MEIPPYLRNRRGQILIETLFVSLMLAMTLFLFDQLVKLQKHRLDPYRFSTEKRMSHDNKANDDRNAK